MSDCIIEVLKLLSALVTLITALVGLSKAHEERPRHKMKRHRR